MEQYKDKEYKRILKEECDKVRLPIKKYLSEMGRSIKITTKLDNFLEWCLYFDINKFRCMDDMHEYEIIIDGGDIKFKDKYDIIHNLSMEQLVEFTLTEQQTQRIFDNTLKMKKVENFIKFGCNLKTIL